MLFRLWLDSCGGCSEQNNRYQQLMQDKYHRALGLVVREVSLLSFEKYILQSGTNRQELFSLIHEANTQGVPRFNVWRMLLDVLPIHGNWHEKQTALQASRKRWATLREQSRSGPKNPLVKQSPNPMPKNPLMKNFAKAEKKETDSDPFLLQEIKKDVDRTYQEMQFFQEEPILKLLTNVLFLWCKLNPDTSYKQGMNQLLASIVYVYFQEAIPTDYQPTSETQQKFHFLNSLSHAQADIFSVFERVMSVQKDMFKQSLDGKVRGEVNPNSKNNSPILQRIIQLQDHKLKALDLDLFRIIKLQDVRTKTFLLRWIRCMHTREFGLFNSLPIWDSILLDAYESPNSRRRNQYEFIDAMCLAMFIYMRALVFTRQTANQIQQIYQKYPELQGNDLKQLIALAWNVIEELRALASNSHSNGNSNWYEDTGKSKDLGLMDKGKETVYKSKLVEKKSDNHRKFDDFAEDNLYPELDSKQASPQVHKKEAKIEEKALHQPSPPPKPAQNKQIQQKSHQKPVENHNKPTEVIPPAIRIKRQIVFQYQQIKGIVQSLKKSIALNDDIQSRALANEALRVLQEHLKK